MLAQKNQRWTSMKKRKKLAKRLKKTAKCIKLQEAELRIAFFVASHSNMYIVDHMIETFKNSFNDPVLSKLSMKRSKCSQIIKKKQFIQYLKSI